MVVVVVPNSSLLTSSLPTTEDLFFRGFFVISRFFPPGCVVFFFQAAHVLVLELCEKGELFDLLHRGGLFPYEVCKEYFRQLMVGISYCHGECLLFCLNYL